MKRVATICGLLGLTTLLGPANAHAAAITGILNIAGGVIVTETTIDWTPLATGTGSFTTTTGNTGYFTTIANPAPPPSYIGTTKDLGPATVLPLSDFLSDFEEVPEVPSVYDDLSFTLTGVVPPNPLLPECVGNIAVDTSCYIGSFTVTQRQDILGNLYLDISFSVTGFFIDLTFGDDGSLNTARGVYTTQLLEDSLNQVAELVALLDGGGSVNTSYSGRFVATAIPEPATLLLFGAGTAALAGYRRRRARKLNLQNPTVL